MIYIYISIYLFLININHNSHHYIIITTFDLNFLWTCAVTGAAGLSFRGRGQGAQSSIVSLCPVPPQVSRLVSSRLLGQRAH